MSLNNFYNYKEFINERKEIKPETMVNESVNSEKLNEGLFDFFKKLFNKLNDMAKKVKSSNEINKIVDAAKKEIEEVGKKKELVDQYLKKCKEDATKTPAQGTKTPAQGTKKEEPATQGHGQTTVQTAQVKTGTKPTPTQPTDATQPTQQTATKKTESYKYDAYGKIKIFEAVAPAVAAPVSPAVAAPVKDDKLQHDDNPIKKYILNFIEIQKKKLAPYLNSKQEDTKLYAQAKVAEIEEELIKMEINVYMKVENLVKNDPEVKTVVEEQKKKTAEEQKTKQGITSKLIDKLGSIVGATKKLEVGKVYQYTDNKGNVKDVLLVTDENGKIQVKTVGADGKPLTQPEIEKNEPFVPVEDNLVDVDPKVDAAYAEVKKTQNAQAPTQELKPGEIYEYTDNEGNVKDIVILADGTAKTIIEDGTVISPEDLKNKEAFKPKKENTKKEEDKEDKTKIKDEIIAKKDKYKETVDIIDDSEFEDAEG